VPLLFVAGPLLEGGVMAVIPFFDFNDAANQHSMVDDDVQPLRAALLDRLESVLQFLFPQGHLKGGKFYVGDIDGAPGRSLVVEMDGPRRGLWFDFAEGLGGDVFDAWALSHGLSVSRDFAQILDDVRQWLGMASAHQVTGHAMAPAIKAQPIDELGPYTAKWDYHDQGGKLIAIVYRYDPPSGKEYRPWDVSARMWRAPTPRPLFNIPAIVQAKQVVLVEGEKAACALMEQGIVATTAMNGAKAPIDKTDWSPLQGRHVLIWPDKDPPGWAYAQGAAQACVHAGCTSVAILMPPELKPEKWDAADAVDEGMDCADWIQTAQRQVIKAAAPALATYTLAQFLDDDSEPPDDLIAPRVLTPAGLLVFGGAPKVGKSDFLLSWMVHAAAGAKFLSMTPSRPLRVFYLQSEVQYHYLRERLKGIRLSPSRLVDARKNFVATPQLNLILDDDGMALVIEAMKRQFDGSVPDVIVVDPIRNVFDGGDIGGENDNAAMLYFLQHRIEELRRAVNPSAGVVLAHHTRKLNKKLFEEDPFQAFSGASSLRGFYSTGMLLFRPDESRTTRQLIYELRNGEALPNMYVDKVKGEWSEVKPAQRLVGQTHGQKLDDERNRKGDTIVQLIADEAASGRVYTINSFGEAFEGDAGLGGERTVKSRVSVLATKGDIKFFRNPEDYGLAALGRSKFGYMCVQDMVLNLPLGEVDTATAEPEVVSMKVLPTHYKCPQTGAILPVEDPKTWIYHEDLKP
jgi:putative DNA primase/helicase